LSAEDNVGADRAKANAPLELPIVAHGAWWAYLAMLDSKQAHYGCLERLDFKYRHGGTRTLAEGAQLETLLAAHDRCVREFASAIKALGAAEPAARDVLITLMSEIVQVDKGAAH